MEAILKEKEREILVGKNRIYIGEDNIVHYDNIGEIDEKIASESCEAMLKLMKLGKGNVAFFINLNKGGKTTGKARSILKEFTENHVKGKLAFYGLHPVAGMLVGFFMDITRKNNMRFFRKEEEAINWLRE